MIWPFKRHTVEQTFDNVDYATADLLTGGMLRPPGAIEPLIQAAVELQVIRTAEAIDRAVAQSLELGVGTVVITQIDGTVRASPSTLVPHQHSYHFPSEAAFRVFVLHHPKGRP